MSGRQASKVRSRPPNGVHQTGRHPDCFRLVAADAGGQLAFMSHLGYGCFHIIRFIHSAWQLWYPSELVQSIRLRSFHIIKACTCPGGYCKDAW
jgi:hypothetical protein